MKIKVTAMPISQYGTFHPGDILTDEGGKLPTAFLNHLVHDCNAAEILEYDTKVIEVDKTKASPKKKRAPRKKRSSASAAGHP